MAETRTYDSGNVSVIVKGVYLTGFSDNIVEIDKAEDSYTVKVGAQGDTARAKANDKTGTIKVTLQQTSPQIAFLDGLANTGELVPVTVIYAGDTRETSSATEAFVKKPATRTYGKEIEDREYEFQCLDLKME